MSETTGLESGGARPIARKATDAQSVYLHAHRPLRRLLEFRRRTIDDVVNSRVVKNEVAAYWKFEKQIRRGVEIAELERQWNAVRL